MHCNATIDLSGKEIRRFIKYADDMCASFWGPTAKK